MKIGLFIPCYINEIFPNIAISTLTLLEGYGVDVEYPFEQTCCGQALSNNGDSAGATKIAKRFSEIFKDYDYIVAPSSSCVSYVSHHFKWYLSETELNLAANKTIELIEFLQDVLQVTQLPKPVSFPYKVSVHQSCHGLRKLLHSTPSELVLPYQSRLDRILSFVDGIQILKPERVDECCGFGGTYCVDEPEVSTVMGEDRVAQHEATGAEFIVGAEASCMIHMGGIIRYHHKKIRPVHVSEILANRVMPSK